MELKLTDSTGQIILPEIDTPFVLSPIYKMTEVEVAGGAMYFDYVGTKRTWIITWSYMTDVEFNIIKGYLDRQLENGVFPELTDVTHNAVNVVVYMTLNEQNIIDTCGNVSGVTLTLRETIQMSTYPGVS